MSIGRGDEMRGGPRGGSAETKAEQRIHDQVGIGESAGTFPSRFRWRVDG